MMTTSDEPSMGAPSLTLAMIVRDEAPVIERCLITIRPLLASWVIVDTGSSDDTVDRIERALDGIPGTIHHRPWVDFGRNRSELLALARGIGTHLLLLDADMTVRIDGPLDLPDADAISLRQEGNPEYWVPRIVRADLDWRYEGTTHEVLVLDRPFTEARCRSVVIEHHADGSSRSVKLERDRELLERAMRIDPTNPRAAFYLAQTLRDLGETDAAIAQYRARIDLGGWDQEIFYCHYMIGVLLASIDWDAAVPALQRAWEFRPTRVEPLYVLARGWRERGEYALAYDAARTGLAIEPTDDSHFVHSEAHDWGLRFECSIGAFHVGRIDESRTESERLLRDGVPAPLEPWVRQTLAWCDAAAGRIDRAQNARLPLHGVTELPLLHELAPSTRLHEIVIDVEPGWTRFNPSIASRPDGGFLVNVRSSNYRFLDGRYVDPDGQPIDVVRTVNHLVTLDAALGVVSSHRVPTIPSAPGVASSIVGCEDLRLFTIDGDWLATATTRDRDASWTAEMALLALEMVADRVVSTTITTLDSPIPGRHEKNWMPFVVDDGALALYLCDPTTVLRLGRDGGTTVISTTPGPPGSSGFRGGSQGVAIDDGHLFVVHEVVDRPEGRLYAHRLVVLRSVDGVWAITAMSAPFRFTDPTLGTGIEFCAGLAIDGDRALLSFGVDDTSAWIAECPLDELLALLVPVRSGADRAIADHT